MKRGWIRRGFERVEGIRLPEGKEGEAGIVAEENVEICGVFA